MLGKSLRDTITSVKDAPAQLNDVKYVLYVIACLLALIAGMLTISAVSHAN